MGLSCSAACGIFPDQGSNPCPLHWQADSQPLHHQGSPRRLLRHASKGLQTSNTGLWLWEAKEDTDWRQAAFRVGSGGRAKGREGVPPDPCLFQDLRGGRHEEDHQVGPEEPNGGWAPLAGEPRRRSDVGEDSDRGHLGCQRGLGLGG